jgi:hypothetical protein
MNKIEVNHLVLNKFSQEIDGWGHRFKDTSLTNIILNSKNFRCEEFIKDHVGEHILFSGCSTTFGIGLEEDEVWSKKLYKKIKENKKVSGYFNLSMPGIGCLEIVANIFKYINKFGNPNVLFVCLPNIERDYIQINQDSIKMIVKDKILEPESLVHGRYLEDFDAKSLDDLKIKTFHYLLFLEIYCKSNNIKLYYFSWDYNFPTMDLNRFFTFSKDSFIDFFKNNSDILIKEKYSITSRDEKHVGTAYHDFWSDSFYDIYIKESENVN